MIEFLNKLIEFWRQFFVSEIGDVSRTGPYDPGFLHDAGSGNSIQITILQKVRDKYTRVIKGKPVIFERAEKGLGILKFYEYHTLEKSISKCTIHSIDIISGGWGKGPAPSGHYSAVSYREENGDAYSLFDIGFFVWIIPQFPTDRSELGIHFDGNVPGTLGCIGLKPKNKEEAIFWRDLFARQTYPIPVQIV